METVDRKYTISQKVALKSLQNDQVTIAGHKVELRDLKNTAHYAMDCIAVQLKGRS
jgi:lipopolysaccharide export system protein LptA